MPPPLPPSLSPPLARGGLADSPSSPRPPSMRRAGARGNATTPAIRFTYQRAGGRRPRRAFPGKMELRWVAWYVVRTVGGGGGGRCTEEARDTRHATDGGGGRGGGQKAREQTPCSLSHSHSLPTVYTPRHSVGSSLHRTPTLRSHMQKGECDQRTNVWLGSKFYAHKE